MPTLTITQDDGTELLRVQIKGIVPAKAALALLETLAKLEPEKKTRSDAGKKRQPKLLPPAASSEAAA